MTQERACFACSCTDDHACEGGCWWVKSDLCSACWIAGADEEVYEP